MQSDRSISARFPYALAFCIGAATLGLQLVQTRIYSVVYWNHLVYFVISIALLGFGISGTWLAVAHNTRLGRALTLERSAIAFGVSALLSCLVAPSLNITMSAVLHDSITGGLMLVTYAAGVFPYFFAGWILGSIYRDHTANAGALYMCDLVGAATGCLAFLGLIRPFGAVGFLVACCVIAYVPFLAANGVRLGRLAALALFVAVFGWGLRPALERNIEPEPTKTFTSAYANLEPGDARIVEFTEWNPISRIDVVSTQKEPGIKRVYIDGDAWTGVATPERVKRIEDNKVDLVRLPLYGIEKLDSALVIGSGGGMDVRRLLQFGSPTIDCVEINPTTARIVLGPYLDATERVFERPGIALAAEDGRSFARRTRTLYDVIVMSSVDTFAAISTGAYVLSENYLYTVDAFEDYISRLQPNGMLVVTRWATLPEATRLFAVALEALHQLEIPNPEQCLTVYSNYEWFALYIKKTPFPAEAFEGFDQAIRTYDAKDVFREYPNPAMRATSPVAEIMAAYADARTAGEHEAYLASLDVKIDPVYDDSPFFFHYDRFRDALRVRGSDSHINDFVRGHWASFTLLSLFAFLTVAVAVFMFAPLLKHDTDVLRRSPIWLVYFAALGLSFICVEIALMQRFALLLGHPARSLALVLASLLFFAGLGSGASGRWRVPPAAIFAGVLSMILCCAYAYPLVTPYLLGLPLAARGVCTVLLVAPIGFFLGMPFPWGLRALGAAGDTAIPWMWGVNGGTTVLGSVFAIIVAMTTNFTTVFWIAFAGYSVAAAIGVTRKHESPS